MIWNNLKENKCPKCSRDFWIASFADKGYVMCFYVNCDFRISTRRFSEIVNSQVTALLEKQWEQEYQDNLL